jgi:hypothetical protein
MDKWIIGFGSTLVFLGTLFLSPLIDLLPVELSPYLSGDFSSPQIHYFRVVPAAYSRPDLVASVLFVVGAFAIAIGCLIRYLRK